MKAHLQNYPKLWKLVRELPQSYRNATLDYEALTSDLRNELESVSTTEKLAFPYRPKSEVISILANEVRDDFGKKNAPREYRVIYDEVDHRASIDGCMVQIPLATANTLAEKMSNLARNTAYGDRLVKIMNEYDRIRQKTSVFLEERDAIVEEIRLSCYKNLKKTPWYKRLDC
jgi:hypothetical protein